MRDLTLYDPAYARRAAPSASQDRLPGGRMIAYSWDCSPAVVATELSRGAAGYIGKRVSGDRLVDALMRAHAGQVVVDLDGQERDRQRRGLEAWPLTKRETSVISLIAQGLTNAEIVEHTQLSINSIKSYIRSAYRKMDVASRSQAVLWGVQHGLLVGGAAQDAAAEGASAPGVTSLASVRPVAAAPRWSARNDIARAQ